MSRVEPRVSIDVLGVKFTALSNDQAIDVFQEWIDSKQACQVCFANVHMVVGSMGDEKLRVINNNSFNAMDGLPLVWYARLVRGARQASRVSGPDLMLKCLDEGRNRNWKHFFLGGTKQVLKDLADNMRTRYPGVEIAGCHSLPFKPLSAQEDAELVEMINAAKPDFLWVALGMPKQEFWIAAHLHRIQAPVQLGVGAAFNFHSGHVRRAPSWMQTHGLEWLHRLFQEKRLFKRYLTTNPIFLLLLVRDIILIRLFKLGGR